MAPTGGLGRRCSLTSWISAWRRSSRSGIRGAAFGPHAGNAGADETADDGGVFGNDGRLPAIDLEAVVYYVVDDLAVTSGGDTGQAEFLVLTDDATGMAVADARSAGARQRFLPDYPVYIGDCGRLAGRPGGPRPRVGLHKLPLQPQPFPADKYPGCLWHLESGSPPWCGCCAPCRDKHNTGRSNCMEPTKA